VSFKRQDHDFDTTASPGLGTNWLEWVGLQPDTGDGTFGFGRLMFFNGISPSNPGCEDASGGTLKCFVHRDSYQQDVKVQVGFQALPGASLNVPYLLKGESVFARISGGSFSGGGTDTPHIENCDGYEARFDYTLNESNQIMTLYRYDAGSQVLIHTRSMQQVGLGPFNSGFKVQAPHFIRLELDGADYEVWLGVDNVAEVLVLSGTDTEGPGPHLSAGRCGFGISEPRSETFAFNGFALGTTADACHYVDVRAHATNTALMREDWGDRLNKNGYDDGNTVSVGPLNFVGSISPGSAIGWDHHGPTRRLTVQSGKLRMDTTSGITTTVAMWARGETDPYAQRYSCKFTMSNNSHDDSAMGIGLRISQGEMTDPGTMHTPANVTGYVACVGDDDAGSGDHYVRIYRYNGGDPSTPTLLAKLEQASLFTLGVEFTFDFSISPLDNPPNTPAVMVVRMDTGGGLNIVNLVAESIPGVSDNGSGTITDATVDRVNQGFGVALYSSADNANTQNLDADDWTSETPTAPQPSPTADLDNVDVETEQDIAAAKSGLLLNDFCPVNFAFTIERLDPRRSTEVGAYNITSPRFVNPSDPSASARRLFNYSGSVNTQHELKLAESFFDNHNGLELAFDVEIPGGEVVCCQFLNESFPATKSAPDTWSVSFNLIELFP
jgi:hypothetical protein